MKIGIFTKGLAVKNFQTPMHFYILRLNCHNSKLVTLHVMGISSFGYAKIAHLSFDMTPVL
jgi:hypothetical protein